MADASPTPKKHPRPARKRVHYRQIAETRAELASRFPACIAPKGGPKKPIMRGIHAHIIKACPDIRPLRIMAALDDYTFGPTYLLAMLTEPQRVDLAGAPVEAVSDHSRNHARGVLATHWPKWLEKVAA